jgi:hypothetical protein
LPTLALNPPAHALLGRFFKKAFVGIGGIRAGWRLTIFLAIFIGLIATLGFIARTLSHTKPSQVTVLEPRSMLHNEVGGVPRRSVRELGDVADRAPPDCRLWLAAAPGLWAPVLARGGDRLRSHDDVAG